MSTETKTNQELNPEVQRENLRNQAATLKFKLEEYAKANPSKRVNKALADLLNVEFHLKELEKEASK